MKKNPIRIQPNNSANTPAQLSQFDNLEEDNGSIMNNSRNR